MSERKRSIINQIETDRKQKAERAQSIAEAQKQLPSLKAKLANLINTHVPKPEIKEVSLASFWRLPADYDERREKFETTLKGKIPAETGPISVTVSSSKYPKIDNDPSEDQTQTKDPQNINYKIEVTGLDYYFVTKRGEPYLESRATHTDMPRHNPIIGHKYNRFPDRSELAGVEELIAFQELVDELETNGYDFEGSTPAVIEVSKAEKARISENTEKLKSRATNPGE